MNRGMSTADGFRGGHLNSTFHVADNGVLRCNLEIMIGLAEEAIFTRLTFLHKISNSFLNKKL